VVTSEEGMGQAGLRAALSLGNLCTSQQSASFVE